MQETLIQKIIEKYGQLVFNIAYRFTGNYDDAKELSQEVFLKLLTKFDSKKSLSEKSLTSWLYKVIRNLYVNLITRNKIVSENFENDDSETNNIRHKIESIPDTKNNPEKLAEKNELEEIVKNGLQKLPDKFRITLILSDIEGLSYEEISKSLGCSIGTVRSRIHRGRKMMTDILQKYLKEI